MPKTNFTKVENAVEEGLRKIQVENLLKKSETASLVTKVSDEKKSARAKMAEVAEKRQEERHLLKAAILFDVERLFDKDRKLFTKLNTNYEELTSLLDKIDSLTSDEWDRLMEIKNALDKYKNELDKKSKKPSPDKQVEEQRVDQKNARFNIKRNWLPLH